MRARGRVVLGAACLLAVLAPLGLGCGNDDTPPDVGDDGDAATGRETGSPDASGGEAGRVDGGGGGDADSGRTNGDASAGADADSGGTDGQATDGARPPTPVAEENALPGTTAWKLTNPATAREIEGYASLTSVAPGGTIRFFVNTAAPRYTIELLRLGWYGGLGGRVALAAVERSGRVQSVPSPDATGLVECAWTDPYEVTVPAGWVSGVYVAKLTAKDSGKESYIPFVVRDDVRTSTYLFQSSVTTFAAYNNWGGRSLYDFNSQGGVRASRVSFLRPYAAGLNPEAAAGVGAGELLTNLQGAAQTGPTGWEYPMIRFLEREGYDVSYATNVDVHKDPLLVARHAVFLSVGHDEYWSSRMRDHVEFARDHAATSLAFFSGNVSYWQIRLDPSTSGAEATTVTCTKDQATDPFATTSDAHESTVLFRSPLLGRSEEALGGVAYQDFGINGDLVVLDPSSWVFAGTGLAAGQKLPGLLGYEVDTASEPPLSGVRRITRSPWTTPQPSSGAAEATVRALPSGAETFAAGSIQLAWGLDDLRLPGVTQPVVTSAAAQGVARNVLDRFARPRPKRDLSPVLLTEAFSAAPDPARFAARTLNEGYAAFDPAIAVGVSGGRLTIAPLPNAAGLHHGGIVTARTYPMTCASASVELVQPTSASSTADTTFAVVADPGRYYRITFEGGALSFGASAGGATSIPYDAQAHRHLRIRHDCVADSVLFETSPDAATWTTRRTVPATIDLRAAYLELEAGTYRAEAAPGVASFDNLRLEMTGVREAFAAQRDPETLTPEALHEGGYDPEVAAFVFGGRLHLRPRASVAGQHHMGLATARELDWRGGVAGVTVVQAPSPATEASVSLAIVASAGGWARTTVSAGKIYFQVNDGTTTSVSIPFDAAAHRLVRIRHDAIPDQLVWETSPNGAAWTERRRVARPFAVDAIRAEIEAGTYQAETAPGEILVDDLVVAR